MGHKGYPRYGQRKGRGRSRRASNPVYAAVDLGTNNCRLLMARPSPQGLSVAGSFSRIVRLGEGLPESGNLREDAMTRTIEALAVCAGKIHAKKVRRSRSIATEACRSAVNGPAFLARIKAETGLAMETVEPLEEARLTLQGCAPLLDKRAPHALVFDVGGGSTEVMWIEQAEGAPPKLLDMLSLAKGVVGLAEGYGRELSAAGYAEIMDSVDAGLAPFDAEYGISREISAGRVEMLGTSGTVTMLGGFFLELPRYNRALVDGLDMDFDSISAICATLIRMGHEARAAHPCIGPGRADLVVPGCAILQAVCRRWPAGSLRAADRGIREGLLLGMMAEDAAGTPRAPAAAS